MTPEITVALLLGAVILLVAVGAMRLSLRLGLPVLLIYLALGMAVGESGLGIEFEDHDLARVLGLTALMVIIAEGGLTMRWPTLRPVLGRTAVLSTVGVVVTIGVVGVVLHGLRLDLRLGCRTVTPSSGSPKGWPGWRRSACSCCWACWCRRRSCRPR